MSRAVVLLSGGIDSSTVLAIAKAEGYEPYALTFDYEQRHRVELFAAERVARALDVKQHMVIRFDMRSIGGSALTSGIEVPKTGMEERKLGSAETEEAHIPVTYVPARNTIFLSFGLAWAEVLGAPHIFIGANAVDYSGYPDCRPEYLKAFENMANLATKVAVEGTLRFSVKAPLLSLTKSEIIRKGASLGLDYGLTWSCYDPQLINTEDISPAASAPSSYKPCGVCDSCRFRSKGFQEAGIPDPLVTLFAPGH